MLFRAHFRLSSTSSATSFFIRRFSKSNGLPFLNPKTGYVIRRIQRSNSTIETTFLDTYSEQKIGRETIRESDDLAKQLQYVHQNVTLEDPTVLRLIGGLQDGKRASLAEAITLAESLHPRKRAQAQVILKEVLEKARTKTRHSKLRSNTFRIGMTVYFNNISVYR